MEARQPDSPCRWRVDVGRQWRCNGEFDEIGIPDSRVGLEHKLSNIYVFPISWSLLQPCDVHRLSPSSSRIFLSPVVLRCREWPDAEEVGLICSVFCDL